MKARPLREQVAELQRQNSSLMHENGRLYTQLRERDTDRIKAEQEEQLRREAVEQLNVCRGARERDRLAFAAGTIRTAQMESAMLVLELRCKKAEKERDEARALYNAMLAR